MYKKLKELFWVATETEVNGERIMTETLNIEKIKNFFLTEVIELEYYEKGSATNTGDYAVIPVDYATPWIIAAVLKMKITELDSYFLANQIYDEWIVYKNKLDDYFFKIAMFDKNTKILEPMYTELKASSSVHKKYDVVNIIVEKIETPEVEANEENISETPEEDADLDKFMQEMKETNLDIEEDDDK